MSGGSGGENLDLYTYIIQPNGSNLISVSRRGVCDWKNHSGSKRDNEKAIQPILEIIR
jgi:hypothetical protein